MGAILTYKSISDLMKGNGNLQDITVEDMQEMHKLGFATVCKCGEVEKVTQEV